MDGRSDRRTTMLAACLPNALFPPPPVTSFKECAMTMPLGPAATPADRNGEQGDGDIRGDKRIRRSDGRSPRLAAPVRVLAVHCGGGRAGRAPPRRARRPPPPRPASASRRRAADDPPRG